MGAGDGKERFIMLNSEQVVPDKKLEKKNENSGKNPKVLPGTHEKIVG